MLDYDEEVNDFLEHYGVKGMKWGRRKVRDSWGGGPGLKDLVKRNASDKSKTTTKSISTKPKTTTKSISTKPKTTTKSISTKPKKLTRKEVKAEKAEYYQKKAKNMLDVAMKDPTSLIATVTPRDNVPTVMTGKEFTNYLSRGGQFNVKYSQIYATQEKPGGPYIPRERERYVRSDKVKK